MMSVTGDRPQFRHRATARRCLCALALLVGSVCPGTAARDDQALKAAIVFNLLQFVQWPAPASGAAESPLVLCAQRDAPMWWHLRALEDRALSGGRVLQVRAFAAAGPGHEACAASFVEPTARVTTGLPMLVIADVDVPEDRASVVRLRRAGERIGFEVDLARARRAGLQISSKLLRLASKVHE